jgi:hypothetical protein
MCSNPFHLEDAMKSLIATVGMVAGLATAASVSAATISTPFSVGYGYQGNATANSWNTSETSSSNTLPSGDFSLSIAMDGTQTSPTGPSFVDRHLGTGTAGQGPAGTQSGNPTNFLATLIANYTGTPADADPINPNYQIEIDITQISVYGTSQTTARTQTLNFNETTTGNTQSQAPVTIAAGTSYAYYGPYTQVVWDPADFQSPITAGPQIRTFTLTRTADPIYIDGFEVIGNVVVTYNAAVPEPASLGLMAAAGLLTLRRRRK